MLLKLLALFVLIPLIELALLLLLAAKTSVLLTLVVVVATGIAGTLLARSQGWKTFRRIQTDMSQGKLPTDALLDAAMIFCAGALLLTPGLLTDVFGLSLLVPVCRHWYRQRLLQWIRRNFQIRSFETPFAEERSKVVDAHIVDRPPIGEPPPDDHNRS